MRHAKIDFDVHGLVGIRLCDATDSDAAIVRRQVGAPRGELTREPDIIVRFVDHIPAEGFCYVDRKRNGFTDNDFFVFEGDRKARIAFEQIGGQCEIVCESGVRTVPLLREILNFSFLKHDCVCLHASAFVHRGKGIVITGWANAGKTTTLLAFTSLGASYIGDERIVISGNGLRIYGIPENVFLPEDKCLSAASSLRWERIKRSALCSGIHWLDQIDRCWPTHRHRPALSQRLLQRARSALKSRLNTAMARQAILVGGVESLHARPDKVFFTVSHPEQEISVTPMDPLASARRMSASFWYEQLPLMNHYLAFQFAFSERRNEFLESAQDLHYNILCRALAGKETYAVRVPYPVPFRLVSKALRPFLESDREDFELAAVESTAEQMAYGLAAKH